MDPVLPAVVLNSSGLESYHPKSLEKEFALYWHQEHLLKLREKEILLLYELQVEWRTFWYRIIYVSPPFDNTITEGLG